MPHWVWVVDTTTGHRFDIDKTALRHGLEPVNDPRYPDLTGPLARPRRSKHFVGKDGKPGTYVHRETPFDDQDSLDAARAEAGLDVDGKAADSGGEQHAETPPSGDPPTASDSAPPAARPRSTRTTATADTAGTAPISEGNEGK